jgi:transposase
MQVVYARCCGLDVHKKTVVACVLFTQPTGQVERAVRTFGTMTADLLALSDWLAGLGVTHVAMESTGVYWRPVFNLLEDDERTVVLVNPQHMRAVPGRKTDVKDSEWLADLLRHGLVQPSFIPPAPIRALRELTRHRKALVQQRTQEVNRLQKVLEGANIKLGAVASDILGKSGRCMLDALARGEQDPQTLAELARGRLRGKLPELRRALHGQVQAFHRVLLQQVLAHLDFLDAAIAHLQHEIAQRLEPYQEAVTLLQTIPGVGEIAASVVVAEVGADMQRFPSAKHLASWAGVCPGNKQSAGKRLGGKTTGGNVWLKAVLSEVAWANARNPTTYLGAQFRRLAHRRGVYKALVAVAHSVLVIVYHVLTTKQPYHELGADYFDHLHHPQLERHHVRRLEQLGYTVSLTPLPSVPAG